VIEASDVLAGKVLVVDDQQANVLLLERMLRGAGYSAVESTRDPDLVCDLHRTNGYALILLDLQMPGRDGFRVLEGLKTVAGEGDLWVIVMTAHPGNRERALDAGARDFISKPFNVVEVLSRVYKTLEMRLEHQERQKERQTASIETEARARPLP
jgi:adenylate cyclase